MRCGASAAVITILYAVRRPEGRRQYFIKPFRSAKRPMTTPPNMRKGYALTPSFTEMRQGYALTPLLYNDTKRQTVSAWAEFSSVHADTRCLFDNFPINGKVCQLHPTFYNVAIDRTAKKSTHCRPPHLRHVPERKRRHDCSKGGAEAAAWRDSVISSAGIRFSVRNFLKKRRASLKCPSRFGSGFGNFHIDTAKNRQKTRFFNRKPSKSTRNLEQETGVEPAGISLGS